MAFAIIPRARLPVAHGVLRILVSMGVVVIKTITYDMVNVYVMRGTKMPTQEPD